MRKKTKTIATVGLAFTVVAVVTAVLLVNLFSTKETYKTNSDTTTTVLSLHCKNVTTPEGAFFHSDGAAKELTEVKFTFKDGEADKMSFTYTGNYADKATATKTSSEMHAKYNLYMDSTDVKFSDLSPNFSVIDNQIIISLFFDDVTLTAGTAPLLMLEPADASRVKQYSVDTLSKYYKSMGFSCETTK